MFNFVSEDKKVSNWSWAKGYKKDDDWVDEEEGKGLVTG